MKKEKKSASEKILIQQMKLRNEFSIGTVNAEFGITDYEGSLGSCGFDIESHEINIVLNMSHPGIRAAALSKDRHLLNRYVYEMCFMGIADYHRQHGEYMWPHEEWLEFIKACEEMGREVRHLDRPI